MENLEEEGKKESRNLERKYRTLSINTFYGNSIK